MFTVNCSTSCQPSDDVIIFLTFTASVCKTVEIGANFPEDIIDVPTWLLVGQSHFLGIPLHIFSRLAELAVPLPVIVLELVCAMAE